MQYDQPQHQAFDCLHIDASNDDDIEFWACVLDVSPFQLRRALNQVGSDVPAVVQHLQQLGVEVPVVWH